MTTMLILLGILFGGIFLWKAFQGFMMMRYLASQSPVVTVSATKVSYAPWQPKLTATGSLRAIYGVNVTTELAGMVQTIYFSPGDTVKQNALLVQLNADTEIGQLQALQANEELARITYERDKAQYRIEAVSKQTLETDFQNLKNLQGQVIQQKATVAKKTIRAPFAGRLGINQINLGQYLNPGDKIVSLQTLDPIYIDFYLPQQTLAQLKVGQHVTLTSDVYPKQSFSGKITTIDSAVDTSNRNVEVEATIANPKYELTPGMFAYLEVDVGEPKNYLTIPQTAVTFNPYGDVVYIIRENGEDKNDKPILIAKQAFVTTGETRGDQVTILKGIKAGDQVVTSGQVKLKNGSRVAINNKVAPADNPAPEIEDDEG
ncbi:MAG: efflux RND transporter periplasmic adaptor subunit [Gammaproteobacteria bacterium]|nr:efflux RND transporter periplasmic adaptor subunit [Gammaproteobacteria bacterium]